MRILATLLTLWLGVTTLTFGVDPVSQSKAPSQPGPTKITDAAGRVHVRSARPSYAQRKAAAERRVKALRKAALLKKQAEVKK